MREYDPVIHCHRKNYTLFGVRHTNCSHNKPDIDLMPAIQEQIIQIFHVLFPAATKDVLQPISKELVHKIKEEIETQVKDGVAQFLRFIALFDREKFLFGYLLYIVWQESDKLIAQHFGSAIGAGVGGATRGADPPMVTRESNSMERTMPPDAPGYYYQ